MKTLTRISALLLYLALSFTSVFSQETLWKTYIENGFSAFSRGEYSEAERLFRAAIREVGNAASDKDAANKMIITLNALENTLVKQEKYTDAERVARELVHLMELTRPSTDPEYAISLNNLGLILSYERKYKESEEIHRKALTLREKNEGPNHPNVAASLLNLGKVYYDQGMNTEAAALFNRAFAILTKIPPEDATSEELDMVVSCIFNLGLIDKDQKNYTAAEKRFKVVILLTEKLKGLQHPDLLDYLDNYASVLRAMKRLAEASKVEYRAKLIRSKYQ